MPKLKPVAAFLAVSTALATTPVVAQELIDSTNFRNAVTPGHIQGHLRALQRIAHTLLLPHNNRWNVTSDPIRGDKRIYIATYSTTTPIEWSIDEQRIALAPIQELDPTNPPPPPDPTADDTQEIAAVGV